MTVIKRVKLKISEAIERLKPSPIKVICLFSNLLLGFISHRVGGEWRTGLGKDYEKKIFSCLLKQTFLFFRKKLVDDK